MRWTAGLADLRLDLRYAAAPATPARDAKLEKVCHSIRPGIDRTPVERFMPKSTRVTLEFVVAGNDLSPTSTTARWLETLR